MQLGTEKTQGLDDDTVQLVQGHLIALHSCGSEECHGALGTLVVEEFEARDKTLSSSKLADIISSMKGFYLVPPFNRWWVTAVAPGIPPDTQPGESQNNNTQRSAVINKRQSREHLLNTGIPQMLTLDGAYFEDTEMCLEPKGYASHALSLAYTIITEEKYKVKVPKGSTAKGAPYPEGTRFYFNANGFFERSFHGKEVNKRIKLYEKGLVGDIAGCTSVKVFIDWFLSFNCCEKVGEYIHCNCEEYANRMQCPHEVSAKEIDGQIVCADKLEELPKNKPAGRPRKAVKALEFQPKDIQYGSKPTLRGTGAKARNKKCGTTSTGIEHIGKRIALHFPGHVDNNHPNGIWVGKVTNVTRGHDDSLCFWVFFRTGEALHPLDSHELEQASALERLHSALEARGGE